MVFLRFPIFVEIPFTFLIYKIFSCRVSSLSIPKRVSFLYHSLHPLSDISSSRLPTFFDVSSDS